MKLLFFNPGVAYVFTDEDGKTITVELQRGGDFQAVADRLDETVEELPLSRSQRQELCAQISALVRLAEVGAVNQVLLDQGVI